MTRPETVERKRLARAYYLIDKHVSCSEDSVSARLVLLENVSCRCSGISIDVYSSVTGYDCANISEDQLIDDLLASIYESGIPVAVALTSLARIELDELGTKRDGSVYTDFRLAEYLASMIMNGYDEGAIIDPSCGTSIVLAACAEYVRRVKGHEADFVANSLYGVDLSATAIRGSLLALASYLNNETELQVLKSHFLCADSLELGSSMPQHFGLDGFACVVGNPPWERVRPSRNEYARERGVTVNYGEEIGRPLEGYEKHRAENKARSMQLSQIYGLKGGLDLYRAFLSLSIDICLDGGSVALYLPAGLIRSKSLAPVRVSLLTDFGEVELSVFMNHAKFFAIDARFKFVLAMLRGKRRVKKLDSVGFNYCTADTSSVAVASSLILDDVLFCDSSGELGAPEVKTENDVSVLKVIWSHSDRMVEQSLFGAIRPMRELDMTLDRYLFERASGLNGMQGELPLIEGRMISQFRCGCKGYLSGSGRSAKWEVVPIGNSRIKPQFFVKESNLDQTLRTRVQHKRIGFCDIAGQTNERAMQAAFVPEGCVCGNKVPTLLFASEDAAMLWLGLANSFVFDWVVRRYITTTINFFILENLPLPRIGLNDKLAQKVIDGVRRIVALEKSDAGWSTEQLWAYADERAKLDALVFEAYGLGIGEFETIISDFPLVDRVNAQLYGGARPTIELVRAAITGDKKLRSKAKDTCEQGAMPYVPNEHMRNLVR